MRLEELTSERLAAAIEIYCRYAYGRDAPDDLPRVEPGRGLPELLGMMLDESVADGDEPHQRYALRLGSRDYPYMKLVLEEAFFSGEYFFLVDTHDEIDLDRESPDYSAWLALRNMNHKVKQAVESAWWEANLPTLRSLRERLIAQGGLERAGSREEVILLVEDEEAVTETLSLAMASHGFASLRAISRLGVGQVGRTGQTPYSTVPCPGLRRAPQVAMADHVVITRPAAGLLGFGESRGSVIFESVVL